jgi:hypothetical protein
VGSVGDVLGQVRLKHSAPDLPLRFEYTPTEVKHFGSNVQNGDMLNYEGNGFYKINDSNWGGGRDFKTAIGWKHQDLRAPDKRNEPTLSFSFSSFDNLQHKIFESRRTGDKFLPAPNGYSPQENSQPRGGLVPIVTAIAGGDFTPQPNSVVTNPVVTENGTDLRRSLPGVRSAYDPFKYNTDPEPNLAIRRPVAGR